MSALSGKKILMVLTSSNKVNGSAVGSTGYWKEGEFGVWNESHPDRIFEHVYWWYHNRLINGKAVDRIFEHVYWYHNRLINGKAVEA